MVFNQINFNGDLRNLFCKTVNKIFESTTDFLFFLENEEYSDRYDCFLDGSGECYIIDTETGDYINWYKLYHLGRCISISISASYENIPQWFEEFLIKFKNGGMKNAANE